MALVEPGHKPERLLALTMICRSDARGLVRAVLSAIDEVDEIVIGCDARGDEATLAMARALADKLYIFEAKDIELTDEQWAADRIHFANARNLGRDKVESQWCLFLDTDEYIEESEPIRPRIDDLDPEIAAFELIVRLGGLDHHDPQRLARTRFRFRNATHNTLMSSGEIALIDTIVIHDTSLRTLAERQRRDLQRDAGMEAMAPEAERGDLVMLYHLAKHRLARGDLSATALVEDYRKRTQIHGPYQDERRWLAITAAGVFFNSGQYLEAEQWAVRALFDGPNIETMCLLGNIAALTGDPLRALGWYEAACVQPPDNGVCRSRELFDHRFERLAELRALVGAFDKNKPVERTSVDRSHAAEARPGSTNHVMARAE
jgi:hypothetical protein